MADLELLPEPFRAEALAGERIGLGRGDSDLGVAAGKYPPEDVLGFATGVHAGRVYLMEAL